MIRDCFPSKVDCRPVVFAIVKLLFGTLTVPFTVRFAQVVVPENVGPVRPAFPSRVDCKPLVVAIVKLLFGRVAEVFTVRLAQVVRPKNVVGPARLAFKSKAAC